jgi:hypothetical protein
MSEGLSDCSYGRPPWAVSGLGLVLVDRLIMVEFLPTYLLT